MGCQCSQAKDFEQEEETLIGQCESLLGYQSSAANKICTEILVLTVNERLNWNRLKQLGQVLDLNLGGYEASDEPLSRFYNGLRTGNTWQAYKLGLIAILLGKGSLQSKAELLFNFYDKDYTKTLSANKLRQLLRDLCEVAFVHLPTFAKMLLERQGNEDSADLIQSYIERLSDATMEAVQYFEGLVLEPGIDTVSCTGFKNKALETQIQYLFNARNLRSFTLEHYKEVLRAQIRKRPRNSRFVKTY